VRVVADPSVDCVCLWCAQEKLASDALLESFVMVPKDKQGLFVGLELAVVTT